MSISSVSVPSPRRANMSAGLLMSPFLVLGPSGPVVGVFAPADLCRHLHAHSSLVHGTAAVCDGLVAHHAAPLVAAERAHLDVLLGRNLLRTGANLAHRNRRAGPVVSDDRLNDLLCDRARELGRVGEVEIAGHVAVRLGSGERATLDLGGEVLAEHGDRLRRFRPLHQRLVHLGTHVAGAGDMADLDALAEHRGPMRREREQRVATTATASSSFVSLALSTPCGPVAYG